LSKRKRYDLPHETEPCALYQDDKGTSAVTLAEAVAKAKEKLCRKMSPRKITAYFENERLGLRELPLYREIKDSSLGTNISSRMSPRIPMKKFVAKTNNRARSLRVRHFQKQGTGAYEVLLDSPDSLEEHNHKTLGERRNCKACTYHGWRFPSQRTGVRKVRIPVLIDNVMTEVEEDRDIYVLRLPRFPQPSPAQKRFFWMLKLFFYPSCNNDICPEIQN